MEIFTHRYSGWQQWFIYDPDGVRRTSRGVVLMHARSRCIDAKASYFLLVVLARTHHIRFRRWLFNAYEPGTSVCSVLRGFFQPQTDGWKVSTCACTLQLVRRLPAPFPQVDIIGVMVIVRRARGNIIRSVLCNIVFNNCAQCNAHAYEQT